MTLASFFPYPASAKSFLWKIQDGSRAIFILGSTHFGKPELYPLARPIDDAFNAADTLAVEADVTAVYPLKMLSITTRYAMYPAQDSLDRHISPKAAEEMRRMGIDPAMFNEMRPWYVGTLLMASKLQALGYNPEYGIDVQYLKAAKTKGKKIIELESVEEQFKLMSGISPKNESLFLEYTLSELKDLDKSSKQLFDAWKNGDEAKMAELMFKKSTDASLYAEIYEKLFLERNVRMASQIENILKSGSKCLVIVGAGHLVGGDGIVGILKNRGYTVEQL